MPSLSRHGIGSGKYRIGGTYPENILRMDDTTGRGEELIQLQSTIIDSTISFNTMTKGESDDIIYVGGSSATNSGNLIKLKTDGTILWNVVLDEARPVRVVYDKYNSVVWVVRVAHSISSHSLEDGSEIVNIPYTNNHVFAFQATPEFLLVGHFTTSTNIPNNIVLYDKDGQQVGAYAYNYLRTAYYEDGFIYIAYDRTVVKIKQSNNVAEWTLTSNTGATESGNVRHSMATDNKGNLYLHSCQYTSSSSSYSVNLHIIDKETGKQKRRYFRGELNYNPNVGVNPETNSGNQTLDVHFNIDIPFSHYSELNGNGSDYPVFISSDSASAANIFVRSVNEYGDIYGKRRLPQGSLPNTNQFRFSYMDENKIVYYCTTKSIHIIDPKSYYAIQF